MKQILQDLRNGETLLVDTPSPPLSPDRVLIHTNASLISAGTERMLLKFGKANLLEKARSQPDKVRKVVDKIKTDGLFPTLDAVKARLDYPIPLGYCNAGTIAGTGDGVQGFSTGQRVASNGPHAQTVSVPANLCAAVPDNVTDEEAAFSTLAAIALQGIRLANPTLGETVFVAGLGLVGLLTVQILKANGCWVIGSDIDRARLDLARQFDCEAVDVSSGQSPVDAAMAATGGRGVDAVLIAASAQGSDIVHAAAQMSRKRGRIVLVGVTGLELARDDFYEKELSFQVSCSYGPGRYDRAYEEKGYDYPVGHVRWTAQRNFEAVLGLMAGGALDVKPLISHRFAIEDASKAYGVLNDDPAALGIVLQYPPAGDPQQDRVITLKARSGAASPAKDARCTVGIVGAGNHVQRIVLPALKQCTAARLAAICSLDQSAAVCAQKFGIEKSVSDHGTLLADEGVNAVVIATRHDTHASITLEALAAGKHVFVEKPLCITMDELKSVYEAASADASPLLMAGFNRRFSPHAGRTRAALGSRSGPLCVNYTVNAGALPPDSWIQDPSVGGGRILGEACHFIDTIRFLVGSEIETVYAVGVSGAADGINEDKTTISLKFKDGSIGVVNYWANGATDYPKETIECFADGQVVRIENFRKVQAWGNPDLAKFRTTKQDKGHAAELAAFCDAVATGSSSPIPFEQIIEVTLATFAARESMLSAEPQKLSDWIARLQ